MSFNKLTTFKVEGTDVELLDGDLIKTASVKLPEGHQYDPDYIYLRVKAVSAGEFWGCNKNFDYFPEAELKQWYKTFLTAHVFKNHENKKIEDSIGDVLAAEWIDDMKSVYLTIRIDRRIAPTIVRGFEKGFMTDVSMGCRVDHVVCSYCGKSAKTRFDYCDHLKSMKGKVMNDGKKVYEINIGPKFHDISAVLNGAERTAKAEGIHMPQSKTASGVSTGIEKKASFEAATNEVIEMYRYQNQRVSDIVNTTVSVMEKVAKDESIKQTDVDNAKDSIKNKAISEGIKEFATSKLDSLEKIIDTLKYDYTEYMDKEKCTSIGAKLRQIAKSTKTPIEQVVSQFLKVVDISAIQLSPVEMHYVVMEALDRDTININKIPFNCNKGDISEAEQLMDEMAPACKTQDCISAIKSIMNYCDESGHDEFSTEPVKKIRVIISSKSPSMPMDNDLLQSKIMSEIVESLLPLRSNHRKFLMPRLEKIRIRSMQPMDNSNQFLPVKMLRLGGGNEVSLPMMLTALLSACHENERVASYNDESVHRGMAKFANYFDDSHVSNGLTKVAGPIGNTLTSAKVMFNGIPVIYSYSALQRSRLNNGEDISSFNRFVAENPTNAAFLFSLSTPALIGGYKAAKPLAKNMLKTISKLASESEDLFTNNIIDDELITLGYTREQIQNAKYASVLTEVGKDDVADKVLAFSNADRRIIDDYLKTASACYKIDFEKQANNTNISNVRFQMGESQGSVYLKDAIIASSLMSGLEM